MYLIWPPGTPTLAEDPSFAVFLSVNQKSDSWTVSEPDTVHTAVPVDQGWKEIGLTAALVLTPAHPPWGMKGEDYRQIHLRSAQQQLLGVVWMGVRIYNRKGSLVCPEARLRSRGPEFFLMLLSKLVSLSVHLRAWWLLSYGPQRTLEPLE